MLSKKCIKCGKVIIKQPSEGKPYWKTKRFCSVHCFMLGDTRNKGKKRPALLGNKNAAGIIAWNKGLTTKTDRRVAELGKKSGASRLNKPKLPYRIQNGYKYIFMPNHPRANIQKLVPEQILIMEKHIGRYLTKKELVHHENRNKLDNRIENLRLFKNKSEHMRFHLNLLRVTHPFWITNRIGHEVSTDTRKKISKSLIKFYNSCK